MCKADQYIWLDAPNETEMTKHSTARKPSFLEGLFFWGALAG